MRVGLDYLPAVTHAPGAGRYARELVRALVRLEEPAGLDLRLLQLGGARATIGEPALGLAGARVRPRLRRLRLPRRLAARIGLTPERLLGRLDLFHRVDNFDERRFAVLVVHNEVVAVVNKD